MTCSTPLVCVVTTFLRHLTHIFIIFLITKSFILSLFITWRLRYAEKSGIYFHRSHDCKNEMIQQSTNLHVNLFDLSPFPCLKASWTRSQVLKSVCPLDWQCIRVNSQVIKKKPFKPILSFYLLSLWLNPELLSTIWSSRPGLGGKQSLSYSAELMPVWLNALDTNSGGFWSLHHYSSLAYRASLIVLLSFWPSSAEANLLYHHKMTIVCRSNHLKIQWMWMLHQNGCHFENAVTLYTEARLYFQQMRSGEWTFVYIPRYIKCLFDSKHNPNCHLAMPAPSPISHGSLKVTKCCHV